MKNLEKKKSALASPSSAPSGLSLDWRLKIWAQKEKLKKQKQAEQKQKLVANSKKLRQLNAEIQYRIYALNDRSKEYIMDDYDAGEHQAQQNELEFLLRIKRIYGE